MAEATFGERLAESRRRKGETIEEVSEQLRIRPSIILAMETSNFSHMPHKGYARNMVSSYARYVGLDSTKVTEQFLREFRRWESTSKREGSGNANSMMLTSKRSGADDGQQSDSDKSSRGMITAAGRNKDRISLWGNDDTRDTDRKFREQLRQVKDDKDIRENSIARQNSTATRQGGSERQGSATRQGGSERQRSAARKSGATRRTSSRKATSEETSPATARRVRTNNYKGKPPKKSALSGIFSGISSRPIVLIIGLAIAFVAILILWAVLANTCSNSDAGNAPITGVTSSDEGLSEDQASNNVGDIEAQVAEDNRYGPFDLVVEVIEEASWLQIDVDGTTVVGETCAYPWTGSYTVTSSCSIQAGAPSYVKVYRNGIEVELDTSEGPGVLELEVEQRPIVQNAQDTDAAS